jgi:adenylylsulfate kinase-like enzyme
VKVRNIFRQPIDRRIEEVIKVDLTDEATVAYELAEYVVTDRIRREFEKLLDAYQETATKPSEATNVWVSGFFGSGKSSFAKIFGLILENPLLEGKRAADRFFERCDDPRLRALLSTCHTRAPALSVFVDLSTSKNLHREGEPVALPLYRALLGRLGYSRDILLAELEFALEGDGELEAFEQAFARVTGGKHWRDRRNVALARNEASHALHLLRPDTYPSPDSWARTPVEPTIDHNWFVTRAVELLRRRARGARRLVFIVDEVGQYVARHLDRLFDLMGLAHAVQKRRGDIWLVVTSQEKLEDIVDALESKRVELARVRDRFPLTVDLVPADIEEVVARRLLEKTSEADNQLRQLFRAHRNKLAENIRLSSPTRQRDLTEEDFVRLYPLLPYQIQLFIDIVSHHRARGGGSPMLGGSNRTLIKLAQQLIVHPRTRLSEQDVGALATSPMAYDLLDALIPTSWQAEIDHVARRHGSESVPTNVAKVVALVAGVPALRMDSANIAALMHPHVEAETLRPQVDQALGLLTGEDVLRYTEDGYRLQSPEEKDWERERRGIDLKPAQWAKIRRETIGQLLEGSSLSAERRTFRVAVLVAGERVQEGELSLAIEELNGTTLDDLRARSRHDTHQNTLFWAYRASDATIEAARELHRSREMIRRHETTPTLGGLIAEEKRREERAQARIREQLKNDLLRGTFLFRGVEEEPKGPDPRDALKEAFAAKLPDIFPQLSRFGLPVRREHVRLILHADSLEGLPDCLQETVVRATPEGLKLATDTDPLAAVLAQIRERTSYGIEATGSYLEQHFGAPPYGAPVEAVQAFVAALLRAGLVEVISQGARIANPRDARLDRVFGTLPGFRAALVVPQREVDPDMRARVARRLQQATGDKPPIATDELAARLRAFFTSYREPLASVTAALQGLGMPVPDALLRARQMVEGFRDASDEEVIKTCDEAWGDLMDGLRLAERLASRLDEEGLGLLRTAQDTVRHGTDGLGPQGLEKLERLRELLAVADLAVDHMGEVRSLVADIKQEREAAWHQALEDLRNRVTSAKEELRSRYGGRVAHEVLHEHINRLEALLPPPSSRPDAGPSVDALRGRAAQVEAEKRRAENALAHV